MRRTRADVHGDAETMHAKCRAATSPPTVMGPLFGVLMM